jgi:hypothetical protein
LSAEKFAAAFVMVQRGFTERFRDSIVVTGRDHAEHLSLYGKGGALDLRTKGMTPTQVAYVVAVPVGRDSLKDFSRDRCCSGSVAPSRRLVERAGTGRTSNRRFASRQDAFTVN